MSAKSKHKPVTLAKSVHENRDADHGAAVHGEAVDAQIQTVDEKAEKTSVKSVKASKAHVKHDASDVTGLYRTFAERTLDQAREAYTQVRSDALTISGKFEESSSALTEGTSAFQSYVVKAMQAQADEAFSYFRALTEVKTFSDAIELQSSHSRKTLDASLRQFRDLSALMNDIAVKAATPIRSTLPHAKS